MPPRLDGRGGLRDLLQSQLATVEHPRDDALTVHGAADVEMIVSHTRLKFGKMSRFHLTLKLALGLVVLSLNFT